MENALILDIPPLTLGKFRLELVPVIGPDLANAERERLDDVIDEVDGAGLGMLLVNLERPNARCVISSSELKAADLLPVLAPKRESLHVHLDVVAP